MTEYDDEIERGRSLAGEAAAASAALNREATRIGAVGGQPVPPDTGTAAGDAAYRTAWRREVFASQMFWTWVKQQSRFVTDQDLGVLLRVLAGQDPATDDDRDS
ncbi:hypothetical protein ABLG96_20620 [Nakamurella sp. A5-74]|uniref:Uncharacterized protein n=1 Tax=Nakamurella sp. A5-74 TaxID=3158264 RepID=A0AAU8DP40_9ACTN